MYHTFTKDFFSETTGPISIKFKMQLRVKDGKKIYIFGLGRMTKMAAMPTYRKNLTLLLQTYFTAK